MYDGGVFGSLVVMSNAERINYLPSIHQRLAASNFRCVLKWPRTLVPSLFSNMSLPLQDHFRTVLQEKYGQHMYDYIVVGQHGLITDNIAPERGLANGTPVQVYGVHYFSSEVRYETKKIIEQAAVGSVIEVTIPDIILVSVAKSGTTNSWPDVAKRWPSENLTQFVIRLRIDSYRSKTCAVSR